MAKKRIVNLSGLPAYLSFPFWHPSSTGPTLAEIEDLTQNIKFNDVHYRAGPMSYRGCSALSKD